LTYKETGTKIHERKEIEISVSSFEKTVELMQSIGCKPTSFQESKREAWLLEFAEITIDTWPHLPPLLEVEAQSAAEVERISLLLGLDFNTAIFESVNALYKQTYGKTIEDVSKNGFFSLAFNSANPFK
jgi:adenylate cyclase class 2